MNWLLFSAGILMYLQFNVANSARDTAPFFSWQRGGDTVEHLVVASGERKPEAPELVATDSLGPILTAASAAVADTASGAILWEKNADDVRSIASLTKLMSLLVIIESGLPQDVEIELTGQDYTSLGYNNFSTGERILMRDLFATALIASDNSAMQALARTTGMGQDIFVKRMNTRAHELGLSKTTFVDTTGLSGENVSTAREVIQLAAHAFRKPDIATFAGRKTYSFTAVSGTPHTVYSTNLLLGGMVQVTAGKTGYVTDSGYNFVAEAVNDSEDAIIAVVLGSDSIADRFQDYKMLAVWAWENYKWSD